MTEWQPLVLGEVLTKLFDRRGITPRKLGGEWADSGVQVVSAKHVYDGRLHLDRERRYVASDVYKRWMPEGLRVGDVLLTSEAPLGEAARVTETIPLCLGQRLFALRPNADVLDARFLYYWLRSASGRAALAERSSGTTVLGIRQAELVKVVVRAPSVEVQRSIADVLVAIDDLIENNRRRVEVLEEMARAIYREWFVHFRYPGHKDAALVDSPLGPLPEGWRLSTCGDELTALGGGTPSKSEPAYWDGGTVPWFTPTDLTRSRTRFVAEAALCITEEGVARSSARRFPAGSVLMTSRATLGVLAIAPTEATTNQGFIVIPPDERWAPGFIYEWLDTVRDELASIATGATFKEITKGAFKRVRFIVPAQGVLDAHRDRTAAIDTQILTLEQAIRNLASMRDLLLPRLVTGQIDVSSLDLDALVEGSVT